MNRKPYPQYKASGVEWLGDVPEHWDVKRTHYMFKMNPSKQEINHLPPETEVSFLPMEFVGEDGSLKLETTRPLEEVNSGYTYFSEGDVVFAKITPCFENGKGAIMRGLKNSFGFGTTELTVMRPGKSLNVDYLYYLTITDDFRKNGAAWMYGAGGQKRVPDEFVREFRLAFPPLSEQQAIAAFLDRETGRIDTLVAKKKRLVELLREKRTALISRAVTKGLDLTVKMKPSGIEWLGDIPEHWETLMVKHTWESFEYGISESLSGDGNVKVLTMGSIQHGKVIIPENGCIDDCLPEMLLKDGDLLFNRTNSLAHVGKVGLLHIYSDEPITFASYLVRLRTNDKTTPEYQNYLLNTSIFLDFARVMALPSINQANLNPTRYGQLTIPLPPLSEQQAIAAFLDRETGKIDALIAKVETAVENLKEYRTALISAAVTGKIDVRQD